MAEEEADARELAAILTARAGQAPELPAWCLWIWRCWWRLSEDRGWRAGGLGPPIPGRIPWTAVATWCDRHGFGPDDEAQLLSGLDAMDVEYLEWHARQRAAAAPTQR